MTIFCYFLSFNRKAQDEIVLHLSVDKDLQADKQFMIKSLTLMKIVSRRMKNDFQMVLRAFSKEIYRTKK